MPTFKELALRPDPPLLVELYAIKDVSGAAVYYTGGRDPVTFKGVTYQPAPITRASIKTDDAMTTRTCQITAPLNAVLGNYITQSYIMATISIWMLFQDFPESAVPLFHGLIPGGVNLNVDNKTVTALCVSPNAGLLDNNVPRVRYMPYCQNTIYDNNCGVPMDKYRLSAVVTGFNGTVILAPEFLGAAKKLTYGFARFGAETRDIIYHSGNEIRVSMPFTAAMAAGARLDVYPGCGGISCFDEGKPNGTAGIPSHNPAVWGL